MLGPGRPAGSGGHPVTRLAGLVRGLLHRGGSAVMIFAAALVASAAAATGPAYYAAARTSILHDTVADAGYLGRGFEADQTGAVNSLMDPLAAEVQGELGRSGRAGAARLFAAPVESLETQALDVPLNASIPLVWRSGVCAQLRIRGSCPAHRGQIVISSSLSGSLALSHPWRIGQRLALPGWGKLTITGIYTPPDISKDYWFGRGPVYFPYEHPARGPSLHPLLYDAMFTARATMAGASRVTQGTAVLDYLLRPAHLSPADVPGLLARMNALVYSVRLNAQQVIVTSDIPVTLGTVESGWNAIAVPVLLITAQLLVPVWLLLFLAVRDAAEARGPEIALAKLRGYGPGRSIVFGLSSRPSCSWSRCRPGPWPAGPSRQGSAGCCCGPAPRWGCLRSPGPRRRRRPRAGSPPCSSPRGGPFAGRSWSSGAARAGVRPAAAGCSTPSC